MELIKKHEVLGCTDSFANNYNSKATKDDGSCEYESDNEKNIEILG